ncbi:MAG: SPOR domain-containing protein [Chitinophagales bacterium]|nr:SPOR domain-containing protein [Chitinophagales bacterium]
MRYFLISLLFVTFANPTILLSQSYPSIASEIEGVILYNGKGVPNITITLPKAGEESITGKDGSFNIPINPNEIDPYKSIELYILSDTLSLSPIRGQYSNIYFVDKKRRGDFLRIEMVRPYEISEEKYIKENTVSVSYYTIKILSSKNKINSERICNILKTINCNSYTYEEFIKGNLYNYTMGRYNTINEANAVLKRIKNTSKELNDAYVVPIANFQNKVEYFYRIQVRASNKPLTEKEETIIKEKLHKSGLSILEQNIGIDMKYKYVLNKKYKDKKEAIVVSRQLTNLGINGVFCVLYKVEEKRLLR